ncbi:MULTISPECIES: hypothetical protein [Thalassotalea]|uniref:Uncharacterized protein n=1 Tax=Thalassotalea castellviae TaxID=3075612 RepID=A0ABU3A0F2_9GAMM|nr:hypothetical protein [Thalassotalea sp. W431]MDT0603654.1 hypothetical protein [Thalassotalea sp. W431]
MARSLSDRAINKLARIKKIIGIFNGAIEAGNTSIKIDFLSNTL